ncbi:MAG TPA: phospholipase D family protein [Phycisphaerae bacterium]|nr:phospholipase D family protein [Phycisphaerae bacterium]
MLDPRGRQLLLSTLRPPEGYGFDCAIGTTYSLDLIALLTTPLAFAMFDWQRSDGELAAGPGSPTADPLALLESLRRCADRIHLFCQAGQITIPPAHQRLLAYLEQSVIEAQAPACHDGRQAAFHPKVWIIRYRSAAGPVKYRFVCLSRNLTFDRSWDTVLLLDGELTDRARGFGENRPLTEFVSALQSMALRAVGKQAQSDLRQIEQEIGFVRWELPDEVEEIRFWPMGHNGKPAWPFAKRMNRLLVISPFVSDDLLDRIGSSEAERFLVSRLESLCALPSSALRNRWTCFTLEDALEVQPVDIEADADEPTPEVLVGLHAKVFVADAGWDAHVWTGSANATTAAFGGNVEFLVELVGKKSKLGIDATISEEEKKTNLRRILAPFEPSEDRLKVDADALAAENAAEQARQSLAALTLTARIDQCDGSFTTQIESTTSVSIPENVSVRCRPVMLPAADAKSIEGDCPLQLRFGPHASESISSFVAFEIVARVRQAEQRVRFVLNLPLVGAPTDRQDRLLRDLLKDSRTLLRLLLMMLADDPERLFGEMKDFIIDPNNGSSRRSDDLLPLLEHLLRALDRSPEKLEHVHRLIEDLRRTPEGMSILPADFELVWDPIRRVHRPTVTVGEA